MAYQSFSDRPGGSKSDKKLAAIQLPKDFKGRSALDIGCNEGFFSFEAKRRGAGRVLGIDRSPKYVRLAKERAEGTGVEFEQMDAQEITGEWDYVFLFSALHYIDEPARLFRKIHSLLSPGGTFIFEGGVDLHTSGRTLTRALRSIDDTYFPTLEMLRDVWLKDFAVNLKARSVNQAGDPVNRYVFHCTPRTTSVLFISGQGDAGKSTLARDIEGAVVLSIDTLLNPKHQEANFFYPPVQARFDALMQENRSISGVWSQIKDDPETTEFFAQRLAKAISLCKGAKLVVVEGYILTDIEARVRELLGSDFRAWDVTS